MIIKNDTQVGAVDIGNGKVKVSCPKCNGRGSLVRRKYSVLDDDRCPHWYQRDQEMWEKMLLFGKSLWFHKWSLKKIRRVAIGSGFLRLTPSVRIPLEPGYARNQIISAIGLLRADEEPVFLGFLRSLMDPHNVSTEPPTQQEVKKLMRAVPRYLVEAYGKTRKLW